MKLTPLLISLISTTQAALFHQCYPFSNINKEPAQAARTIPQLQVHSRGLTSLLIYNLLDTEVTNIPLQLDDEDIKTYVNQFTICGLQDVDSGYCQKNKFGTFTVALTGDRQISHPMSNQLIDNTTAAFRVPYSGVWCALLYQDGTYIQNFGVKAIQEFGYLSVLEYNDYIALSIAWVMELAVLVLWLIKKSAKRSDITSSAAFTKLMLVTLCSHGFLTLYQHLKNTQISDVFYGRLEFMLLVLSTALQFWMFLIIFDFASGRFFSLQDQAKKLSEPKPFIKVTTTFKTFLIFKGITEILQRYQTTAFPIPQILSGIVMVTEFTIWVILYRESLRTMDNTFNTTELTNFKRTRMIILVIPLLLTIFKWISVAIYEKFQDIFINSDITSSMIKAMENTVNTDILYSIVSNLDMFSFVFIAIGLIFIWGK